ncbi:MAG: hypothetical protein Q9219_002850 [cf. Caloplaca sp. 3 TL-2023]
MTQVPTNLRHIAIRLISASDDDLLECFATDGNIDYSEWPGLLERILQRLDRIAHHDFPTPSIPLPEAPPPSIQPENNRPHQSSQDSQKENVVPDSPTIPAVERTPQPRVNAIPPPSGTLPPQIISLIDSIKSNLQTTFSSAPPHTVQRLAELILRPRSHYRTLPSYIRALDRVVSVSSPSTVFPLPSSAPAGSGSYLNGTITPTGSNDADPEDTLGGAALTPIPWLRDALMPAHAGERTVGSDLRTESTSVIDGPNGVGSVETVTVAVNGNNARPTATAVTQGELIRQEQEAGVVPVPMARSTASSGTGRRPEEADEEEDVIPHARGPEVIGMEDMGPQAPSGAGFDVEAALGRKGEGEAPRTRQTAAEMEEKEAGAERDADGDTEVVDADGNAEGDERKADSVSQNSKNCLEIRGPRPAKTIYIQANTSGPFKTYGHEAKASLLGGQPLDRSYQPYAGGYHHRQRPVPGPAGGGQLTKIMYKPNSPWTWAFVGVSFVQAAIVLSFEAYAFAKFQQSLQGDAGSYTPSRTIPTFLALYIFGFLYQLILVYDALRLKNTIQVIGLCMYNVGLLIYAAVQMDQIHDAVDLLKKKNDIDPSVWGTERPYLIAIPCIIALGTVLMAVIAWKLYDEFAWTIYKHISADLRMKRRYLTFQIYIALLKFDFFFFLGFTIQFVVVVVQHHNTEFYLTIAAIPVTIIILLMAGLFTRKENTPGMIAIIILYFAGLAYFLFKLVRMYQRNSGRYGLYDPVRRPLTTFAVITVILIILTIVNACMCTANFGRGLKPHIAGRKVESEEEKFANGNVTEMPNYHYAGYGGPGAGGTMGSRMTID